MGVTVLTTRGYIGGHACHWDDEAQIMRYDDTNEPAAVWGGEARPCPQCGELVMPDTPDPCIGYIPGVDSACCGHGVEDGYIKWESCEWCQRVSPLQPATFVYASGDISTSRICATCIELDDQEPPQ